MECMRVGLLLVWARNICASRPISVRIWCKCCVFEVGLCQSSCDWDVAVQSSGVRADADAADSAIPAEVCQYQREPMSAHDEDQIDQGLSAADGADDAARAPDGGVNPVDEVSRVVDEMSRVTDMMDSILSDGIDQGETAADDGSFDVDAADFQELLKDPSLVRAPIDDVQSETVQISADTMPSELDELEAEIAAAEASVAAFAESLEAMALSGDDDSAETEDASVADEYKYEIDASGVDAIDDATDTGQGTQDDAGVGTSETDASDSLSDVGMDQTDAEDADGNVEPQPADEIESDPESIEEATDVAPIDLDAPISEDAVASLIKPADDQPDVAVLDAGAEPDDLDSLDSELADLGDVLLDDGFGKAFETHEPEVDGGVVEEAATEPMHPTDNEFEPEVEPEASAQSDDEPAGETATPASKPKRAREAPLRLVPKKRSGKKIKELSYQEIAQRTKRLTIALLKQAKSRAVPMLKVVVAHVRDKAPVLMSWCVRRAADAAQFVTAKLDERWPIARKTIGAFAVATLVYATMVWGYVLFVRKPVAPEPKLEPALVEVETPNRLGTMEQN